MQFQYQPSRSPKKGWWCGVSIYVVVTLVLFSFVAGLLVNEYRWKIETQKGADIAGGAVVNVEKNKTPEFLSKDVDFNLFWQLWEAIKIRYINKDILDTKLFYGALAGMVASLGDPHSVFFDPETTEKFTKELSGSFEGIGAEIGIKNNHLTVIAPLPDTPADKAGIRTGDVILAIDNMDASGISLDYAISIIRGKSGTNVILKITREEFTEPKDFTITRGVINIVSVKYEMKDYHGKKIAYIEINQFIEDTVERFDKAVRWALEENPDGLIIDLRGNPGGFLDGAVRVASEWVDGELVVTEKFGDGSIKEYKSPSRARLKDYKTMVLINEGSASGSEIVAGALQDYGLATLIGKKTFGKGSVQEMETFTDGSAVKLTVAKWLTPKGREIDQLGIDPDIEIDLTKDDFNNDNDPQLDKALEILAP
ncbi:MAG: S41 family peptidase [Patescibacteria group bacterium]|nr:S41 family peptidase [Patescibacteria group bacterium]